MMNIRVSWVAALCAVPVLMVPAQAMAGTRAQSSKSYTITYTAPPSAASSARGNDRSGKGHLGKDNDDRGDRGPKDGFAHYQGHGHGHDDGHGHGHGHGHDHHDHNQSNGCG